MEGTIKNITERGFGFITVDGEDKDLFFHSSELKGVTFDELSFDKADSPKGPNATNVSRV